MKPSASEAGRDHPTPSVDRLLRFDRRTNAIYEAERGENRATHLAKSILLGLVFYNLYNVTSIYLMPDIFWQSVVLRLFGVTIVSLGLVYLVRRVGPKLREWLVLNGMIGAFSVPVLLFWATNSPFGSYTFSEFDLTLVFGGLVLMLRFRHTMVLLAFAFAITVLAVITKPGLPPDLVIPFIIQSATACIFVMVSNYIVDQRRCLDFLHTLEARNRADSAEIETLQLDAISKTDPLTGLPNRRGLDLQLDAAFAQDGDVVVMMVDIDHFKIFNDTLGHPEGDICLRKIGAAFSAAAQDQDMFCARFGGEEFIFLIKDRPDFDIMRIASSLVKRVRALEILHPGRPDGQNTVTISVGVGVRAAGSEVTIAQVLGEADEALYLAKRGGRNRYEMAGQIERRLVNL